MDDLLTGKLAVCYIAIENGHLIYPFENSNYGDLPIATLDFQMGKSTIESVTLLLIYPFENGDFPYLCKRLPEGF